MSGNTGGSEYWIQNRLLFLKNFFFGRFYDRRFMVCCVFVAHAMV